MAFRTSRSAPRLLRGRIAALGLAAACALMAGAAAPPVRAQDDATTLAQAQRAPSGATDKAPARGARKAAPRAAAPTRSRTAPRGPKADAPRASDATQAQLRALLSVPNRRALNVERMPPAQAEALRRSLVEAFTLGQASARDGGFESSVAGRFDGWKGSTVVRLLDGTRWRQLDGTVLVHHAFMPPVVVYRSGATHRMRIEGVGRSVEVEPLPAREAAPDDERGGAR